MTGSDRPLRTVVADQLNNLAAVDGPLSAMGKRASIHLPELFDASGAPRHGKAALLTAGPPLQR